MQLGFDVQIPDGLLAANALLAENSRQGFATGNRAPYQGLNRANCTAALGLSWSVASGTCSTHVMGRLMSPDYVGINDGLPDPVPYADFTNPQSLNLYSYVNNNPLSNVDPDGHDCIDTSNYSKDGTVTITRGDSCANNLGPNGTYVNGTVDANSITANSKPSGTDFGYSFTSYDGQNGGGGVITQAPSYGPLDGPANQARLNLLSNSAGVVNAAAGLEIDAAGFFFPVTHLALSVASGRYSPGVNAAGIARKPGTLGQFGSTKAENKIAADIVKKTGADREVVHELLQEGSQDAGRALSSSEGLAYVRAALGLIE